jgi:SAM-dependent methyltransferase
MPMATKAGRGLSLLDLGCGTGRDSLHFLKMGFDVTLVDGSEKMCECASKLTGTKARHLFFEDLDYIESFDSVWACASLLHLTKKDLPGVIEKVRSSIKPGGIFFTCFKYGNDEKECNGRYFSYFNETTINELFNGNSGFELLETFITGDVRQGRGKEAWINAIARREI